MIAKTPKTPGLVKFLTYKFQVQVLATVYNMKVKTMLAQKKEKQTNNKEMFSRFILARHSEDNLPLSEEKEGMSIVVAVPFG
jgi:hypothetical protein